MSARDWPRVQALSLYVEELGLLVDLSKTSLADDALRKDPLVTGAFPAAFAAMELGEPMLTWRRDRLSQPAAAHPRTTGLTPPRAPAPWRPGRPLPGSWLGTR